MDAIEPLLQYAQSLTPAQICQGYYLFASTAILTINILPSDVRSAVMDYGARQQDKGNNKQQTTFGWLIKLLQVPHSWFLHFYILSVACSVFWAWQYITQGSVMRWLAESQVHNGDASVEMIRVYVAWVLMMLQGGRRLYESFYVTKTGSSPMLSIHWLVGLAHYAFMSVAVWIEGSGAILNSWETSEMSRNVPRLMTTAVALFAIGWIKQDECHKHLASLKKYTLPDQGWFKFLVCPHYTSECLIYLGLSMVASPPGQLLNRTAFLALVFVAINLGTTARNTKKWYAQKFGSEKVASKWNMIPFVF